MRREIARVLNINERTVGRALKGGITGKKSAAARRLAEKKLNEYNQ
jgi:DNA-binding CsgD family transcriptional regulator